MINTTDVKPLSEAISDPILKAYKAGGYGLVFVFTGTLMLLVTLFVERGIFSFILAVLGTIMILAVLYLFYFQDIKKLKDLHTSMQQNQELIDTVQATAIQMTDLAYDLQALSFKYADEVAEIITLIRENIHRVTTLPMISDIPGIEIVSKVADNTYIVRAEDLSKSIVTTTVTAKSVIEDIKTALVNSDPALLNKYLAQIQELDLIAKGLLQK